MALRFTAEQRRAVNVINANISNARIVERDAKHRRRLAKANIRLIKATDAAEIATNEANRLEEEAERMSRRGRHDGP